ncbi:DUF456 domain-containing protein [bacterium]|nr:DUF456 domain-containing protein [bacterium]
MIVLILLGSILIIVGLLGSVAPGLAGPPFSFLALILLSIAKHGEPFSAQFLVVMGVLTVLALGLDYVLPALGARRYGASKYGFWGAALGMIIGIFFIPPWGMIIGAFLGAVAGELIVQEQTQKALRAGWGVFVGFMLGTLYKLVLSGVMTFYFIKGLF